MFFFLSQAWNKEKILSLHEKSNLTTSASMLRCSAPEPQRLYGEQGPLKSSYSLLSFIFYRKMPSLYRIIS